MNSVRKHFWILGALLALGAALRVFFAACYRFSPNADYGIVALMAKHIMEGRDFPVFYYGQAYMGSLEPMASALVGKLFGASAFNVCLGTAFFGILLLPVIYAWGRDAGGRDAGGRAAGLAAMAFTLIGPVAYLRFLAMPWGGYALTLLLGALILWLSGRLAVRELRRASVPPAWYALLGLLAGVGWWTSQLITAALLTAALVLLAALVAGACGAARDAGGFRVFLARSLPAGAAGFFVGSLPWWLWNYRQGWESFDFTGALGRTSAGAGLQVFFGRRFPDLMDLAALPAPAMAAGLAGIAALVLVAGWHGVVQWRRHGVASPAVAAHATAWLFIIVSAGLFCCSGFAAAETSRYLLPLIPALAVLVGSATACLAARSRGWLGWTPLALLLIFQVWNARYAPPMLNDRTWEFTGQVLNRELAGSGIEAIYCNYREHWLNAATGEAQCFVNILGDRYLPYEWRAENARRIAFLDNPGDVAAFIANSGGAARCAALMAYQFHYDLRAPGAGGQIAPEAWSSAADAQGGNVLAAISDGNLRTSWQAPVLSGSASWIEIAWTNPVVVRGIRFLSPNGEYPPAWVVEGMSADAPPAPGAARWQSLTPLMRINYYFWSGPRLYWNGLGFRAECRFPPARVSRLRVRFEAPEGESEVYVAELTVFDGAAADRGASETGTLDAWLALLQERGIKRLYSERWVANEVALAAGGKIAVIQEPTIAGRTPGSTPRARQRILTPVRLDPAAAILVRVEEAALCRKSLAARRVAMRETRLDPWVLFDFAPGQWPGPSAAEPGLVWGGYNVFQDRN